MNAIITGLLDLRRSPKQGYSFLIDGARKVQEFVDEAVEEHEFMKAMTSGQRSPKKLRELDESFFYRLIENFKAFLKVAWTVFIEKVQSVILDKILETALARSATLLVERVVYLLYNASSVFKNVIPGMAKASLGNPVYGAAAVRHVSRISRSVGMGICVYG
ncbi:hypothetical protein QBC40DRAFT_324528 [Triangularia verruculosa]|uniref:Uncharacterized protein n=1 Tax=Triangularia verruculosa TaxID=2587418 RepID=A0AAN6XJ10_9PEZI|nr:hypothetical protein QBC40DRAFT_324528 [Triangularia verruculosa]